jgi:hypothetical protein
MEENVSNPSLLPNSEELNQDSVNGTDQLNHNHSTEYNPTPDQDQDQNQYQDQNQDQDQDQDQDQTKSQEQSDYTSNEFITPSSITEEKEEKENYNPFSNIMSSLTGEQTKQTEEQPQPQPQSQQNYSNMPVNISNSFQEIINYTADQIVNKLSNTMNLSINNNTLQNGFVSNSLNANTLGSQNFNGGKKTRRNRKKSKKYTRNKL